MENHKGHQRDGLKKKPPALMSKPTDGVAVMKSTISRASKGTLNAIGSRSKTMDFNPPSTKNKGHLDPYSSSSPSEQSWKESESSGKSRPNTIINEPDQCHIPEKNRIRASRIPVRSTEENREHKKESVNSKSLKPNLMPSRRIDTKPDEKTSIVDLDVKIRTVLSCEKDLEQLLMDSPSVKSPAHSGITFMPKKKTTFFPRNIFTWPSSDKQSPDSVHQPSLENKAQKPARKTLHAPSKDAAKEATEVTEKQSVAPSKKMGTARANTTTTSKMLRSKTEASISTNPRPGKPIHKVQSFSRLKPANLVAKKPAHQAILDVTTLVKADSKVVLPPLTTAHSGVPFKPKKATTFASINIFAQARDHTSK